LSGNPVHAGTWHNSVMGRLQTAAQKRSWQIFNIPSTTFFGENGTLYEIVTVPSVFGNRLSDVGT